MSDRKKTDSRRDCEAVRVNYLLVCFAASVLILCPPFVTVAQKISSPLPVGLAIDALVLRTDCPIDLSPDADLVAYTVRNETRRTVETDERYRAFSRTGVTSFAGPGNDIWVTNTRTGRTENLTRGRGTSWTPSWSADGKYLAFYSDRDGAARIWIWERATNKLRRLSAAIARPLFADERILWSSDGKTLFAKVLPENTTLEQAATDLTAAVRRPAGTREKDAATVYVYRSDAVPGGSGSEADEAIHLFNRGLADLAEIDRGSGKVQRLVRSAHVRGYRLSPDGAKLALTTTKQIELNPSDNLHDLLVISLANRRANLVAKDVPHLWTGTNFSFSPDSTRIAYLAAEPRANGKCVILFATGGGETRTFKLPPARPSVQPPLWSKDTESIFLVNSNAVWRVSLPENSAAKFTEVPDRRVTEIVAPFQGSTVWTTGANDSIFVKTLHAETLKRGFYRIDLSDKTVIAEREESSNFGTVETTDATADGKTLVTVTENAAAPPDLWLTSDGDVKNFRRATRIEKRLDAYETGVSRLVEYRDAAGRSLRAALLLPAGYQPKKLYPLLTVVYGGASLSTRANDYGVLGRGVDNLQLFATRGYAVLLPDLPTRGANAMSDVLAMTMPAVDEAIRLGIADPERLGVMGHSFGGYTTLALISQTGRFKAAMMTAGFGNLFGVYGAMRDDGEAFNVRWWETGPHSLGGTPWKAREKYIENSPIFRLDKIETPLLIAHGSRDVSVPPFLADEVFVGLRRLGKKVVYAKYESEGHVPARWGFANQIDYGGRMIDWFDAHLRR